MTTTVIRELTLADAEAMGHIIVSATKQTFTGLVPDAYVSWLSEDERAACQAGAEADGRDVAEAVRMAEEARSAANWRRSMAQDSDRSVIRLAAEVDGEVVGYAISRPGAGDPGYGAELEAIHPQPGCVYGWKDTRVLLGNTRRG